MRFLQTRRPFLVLACLLAAAPVAFPARAAASHSQSMIFQATREMRSPDPAVRAATLDEIQALGARWLRVVLYWRDVAPSPDSRHRPHFDETDPGAYPGWAIYDRIVADARARGIHVLLTVSGPVPRWATRSRHDSVTRPSPTRFRRFMIAVGRRYRRQVGLWSVWNEPNHPQFLKPQYVHGRPYSGRLYRQLYRAARQGLARSGNRHDRVLMGETAPRGNSHVVYPLAFLRGALCLTRRYHRKHGCHSLEVGGWAHHPYTTRLGPWFVSHRRDDVTIGSLGRLIGALDRARRAHAVRHRVNLYLTEFGVQSKPDPIKGVSETRQAEYRSIGEWIAYRHAVVVDIRERGAPPPWSGHPRRAMLPVDQRGVPHTAGRPPSPARPNGTSTLAGRRPDGRTPRRPRQGPLWPARPSGARRSGRGRTLSETRVAAQALVRRRTTVRARAPSRGLRSSGRTGDGRETSG